MAHAEAETRGIRLDVAAVVVALAALGMQVVGRASCHDDSWKVARPEARIRWSELTLRILACAAQAER